jgi:hypothetical protein
VFGSWAWIASKDMSRNFQERSQMPVLAIDELHSSYFYSRLTGYLIYHHR